MASRKSFWEKNGFLWNKCKPYSSLSWEKWPPTGLSLDCSENSTTGRRGKDLITFRSRVWWLRPVHWTWLSLSSNPSYNNRRGQYIHCTGIYSVFNLSHVVGNKQRFIILIYLLFSTAETDRFPQNLTFRPSLLHAQNANSPVSLGVQWCAHGYCFKSNDSIVLPFCILKLGLKDLPQAQHKKQTGLVENNRRIKYSNPF